MQIRFIAHAGFQVKVAGTEILIDPWLRGSDVGQPVIHGLMPGTKTIDFQRPPARGDHHTFHPSHILVSHFHPHHSPLEDIKLLLRENPCHIFTPESKPEVLARIETELRTANPETRLVPFAHGKLQTVGDVTIEAFEHTVPHHMGWIISHSTGTMIHIADPRINSDVNSRRIDERWEVIRDRRPDVLVISGGGNVGHRLEAGGRKWLHENCIASPIEAARLVEFVKPRAAALMGIYNQSVWKNGVEYALPSSVAEEQFYWAASYLTPDVEIFALKPGNTLDIRTEQITLREKCKSAI